MTTDTLPIAPTDPRPSGPPDLPEPAVNRTAPLWSRRVLSDSWYGFSAFPLALVAFVLAVSGFALGVSTLVIWVGFPILVGTVLATRAVAAWERTRLRSWQGREVSTPEYLHAGPGASRVRRALTPLRDVQSWLDLLWSGTGLVTATFAFSVVLVWWAAAAGGLTYWFWQRWLPQPDGTLASLLGLGEGRGPEIVLNTVFGVVAVLTLPAVVRFAAWAHAALAMTLLDSRAELQAELRRVTGARTAAQVAEVDALRRLERDIHDGPQQRLVRLSMDLGRARRQVDDDPELAREILDGALEQARETVAELRQLSRGIAPPLLVDRGLAPALAELAARHTTTVDLHVDVPTDLPDAVQTAAYFVVSEALTNVAKHAGARTVRVRVQLEAQPEGDQVVVEVLDDGVGGAHPAKGRGLAGLQVRVAALGGNLDLRSPAGGPTVLAARIPRG